MKRVLMRIGGLLAAAVVVGAVFVWLTASGGPLTAAISAQTPTQLPLVTLRAADAMLGQISASGNMAPVDVSHVVLEVDGAVQEVLVKPGDRVTTGKPLLRLDTSDLEQAVLLAELDVATAQNTLAQLRTPASDLAVMEARADLAAAQQKLADARTPATATELAAARASVAAAWAKYRELENGPDAAELTKLEANLRKTEIALQEAQRAYDKIKWAGDAGASREGADLQKATIDYEAAKADYQLATAPADEAELQSALSQAHDAQQALDDLLAKPEAADIAAAEAQVAAAQKRLDDLLQGADELEIEAATIKLQRALVTLGQARRELAKASVTAPIDGHVLTVNVQEGQQARAGAEVMTLADLSNLELIVAVAEVDISKVALGQPAEVTIDALPGRNFTGVVTRMEPVSSDGGAVSYAVTLTLDGDLDGVLPDMTAVARFVDASVAGGWLVPTAAIQRADGVATIQVQRNGVLRSMPVRTGAAQGEWTVVYAEELQAGDQVVGAVSTTTPTSRDERANIMRSSPGGGAPPVRLGGN
ncbi:MAG TPA: efflux RND transporter periplasmic adaptor subunit [Chloroflexi bacterium]|nr:efflux RND transporter periplasmic adaptor subunit [Chloroflexota bacterium]